MKSVIWKVSQELKNVRRHIVYASSQNRVVVVRLWSETRDQSEIPRILAAYSGFAFELDSQGAAIFDRVWCRSPHFDPHFSKVHESENLTTMKCSRAKEDFENQFHMQRGSTVDSFYVEEEVRKDGILVVLHTYVVGAEDCNLLSCKEIVL